MEIVEASADHLDAWGALRAELWGGGAAQLARDARAVLEADDQIGFLALDANGAPIGFIEASARRAGDGTYGFVEAWYVRPSHRGRGVGGDLMDAVEQWTLHREVRALFSDTDPESYPASLPAHAREGFEVVSRAIVLRKRLAPDGVPKPVRDGK